MISWNFLVVAIFQLLSCMYWNSICCRLLIFFDMCNCCRIRSEFQIKCLWRFIWRSEMEKSWLMLFTPRYDDGRYYKILFNFWLFWNKCLLCVSFHRMKLWGMFPCFDASSGYLICNVLEARVFLLCSVPFSSCFIFGGPEVPLLFSWKCLEHFFICFFQVVP